MINYDNVTKENIKDHNPNWPQIPDHLYRILMIVSFESGKTNTLLNQIKQQDDDDYSVIDKILRIQNEAKYQYLIKKHETLLLKT